MSAKHCRDQNNCGLSQVYIIKFILYTNCVLQLKLLFIMYTKLFACISVKPSGLLHFELRGCGYCLEKLTHYLQQVTATSLVWSQNLLMAVLC